MRSLDARVRPTVVGDGAAGLGQAVADEHVRRQRRRRCRAADDDAPVQRRVDAEQRGRHQGGEGGAPLAGRSLDLGGVEAGEHLERRVRAQRPGHHRQPGDVVERQAGTASGRSPGRCRCRRWWPGRRGDRVVGVHHALGDAGASRWWRSRGRRRPRRGGRRRELVLARRARRSIDAGRERPSSVSSGGAGQAGIEGQHGVARLPDACSASTNAGPPGREMATRSGTRVTLPTAVDARSWVRPSRGARLAAVTAAGPPASEGVPAAPDGWKLWLAGARPRTLPAAVVPVLVGTAAAGWATPGRRAHRRGGSWPPWWWRLALQIGTNYANDYCDGVRGTDDEDRVGPLRLVGSGLATPGAVKRAALLSFGVAGARRPGPRVRSTTWWLILVGVVCVRRRLVLHRRAPALRLRRASARCSCSCSSAWWPRSAPPTCRPRTHRRGWRWRCRRVPVGLLATALLVVNNLRDIPSDTEVGQAHAGGAPRRPAHPRPLRRADGACRSWLVPIVAGLGGRPLGAARAARRGARARRRCSAVLERRHGARRSSRCWAQTGRVQLVFGVLLAVGLFISA